MKKNQNNKHSESKKKIKYKSTKMKSKLTENQKQLIEVSGSNKVGSGFKNSFLFQNTTTGIWNKHSTLTDTSHRVRKLVCILGKITTHNLQYLFFFASFACKL